MKRVTLRIDRSSASQLSRLLLLIVTIALTPVPAAAQVRGEEALRRAERLVYSQSGEEELIAELLESAREEFQGINSAARRSYSLGRVSLLRGIYYNSLEDSRRAEEALEATLKYAEKALQGQEFSEAHRLLADAHSQMMFAKGLFYMMRHGGTARDAAFRALELDPNNPRAIISVAGYYLNAPPVAGGDPAEGVALLRRGTTLDEAEETDLFLMYLWLSDAYAEREEYELAREYRSRARRIFPESPLVSDSGWE